MSGNEHDPVASTDTPEELALAAAKTKSDDIVTCDACPVLCRIRPGKTGACDRYGNIAGKLARIDPFVVAQRTIDQDGRMVPFLEGDWDGDLVPGRRQLRHRHRRRHHLSRLQAGAVHRLLSRSTASTWSRW